MNVARFARLYLFALVSLLALLSLAPVASVAAAGPERVTQTFPFGPDPYPDCGSFQAVASGQIERFVLTWYDEAGNPLLERRHVYFTGTVTNPLNGKTLPYEAHFMRVTDFQENTLTVTGLTRLTRIPGVGVVAHEAGRVVYDDNLPPDQALIFMAGPHEWESQVCAALT